MPVHPPIASRPSALWDAAGGVSRTGWQRAHDESVVEGLQSALRRGNGPLDPRELGLLAYRPDLTRRLGPAALKHPGLKATLFSHPACALDLLCGHYHATSKVLEPALAGSGQSVFHLLHWASRQGKTLGRPADFYRPTLVSDSYWGLRQAHATGDTGLLAEVAAWCGDERRRHAAAAAYFLMHHPREAVGPYRELLVSNPFYAYVALPRLAQRGFHVEPSDVAGQPKWACQFALSRAHPRPDDFIAGVCGDPGWIIELAAGRGWLGQPEKRREVERMVAACPEDHPLRRPAFHLLRETVFQTPRPSIRAPELPRAPPEPLTSGQSAEAQALGALKMAKNTEVWRPSAEQVATPAFRQIVGQPRFTGLGRNRGTVIDSVEGGFAEIKSGTSVLNSSYQLRLQTYRSLMEDQPFKIYTNRPVDAQFAQWLSPWGVKVEPLPGPLP